MSLELLVILAAQQAPSAHSWGSAVKDSHLPLQFAEQFDPNKTAGFVPITVQERNSRVYFLRQKYTDAKKLYPELPSLKLDRPIVYTLAYGARPLECASAFYSASILVAKFGGVAFDPRSATTMSEQDLLSAAKDCQGPAASE